MKIRNKTMLACAGMILLAGGCQKEQMNQQPMVVVQQEVTQTMVYSVDGQKYQIRLVGEEARMAFLQRMLALAEEGHRVTFRYGNSVSTLDHTKESVTYTTSDHGDALNWSQMMLDKGYQVTIIYDKEHRQYVCTAEK